MPRIIQRMDDGTIHTWSAGPRAVVIESDGVVFRIQGEDVVSVGAVVFRIQGVRRRRGHTTIYGSGVVVDSEGRKHDVGAEFDVGPEKVGDAYFDVADAAPDVIPGITIIFDDYQADILAKLHADTQARVTGHRVAAPTEIPTDRTFRRAWRDGGDKIDVDMPTAREVWRDRMRAAREPKLASLDVEYQRADEGGDAKAKKDVAAAKQALRDVTADPAIEAARTPEELKAVWPAILN